MKRPTIKDIAEAAEVSSTAVSFTLNDRPGVSDETRKRIRKIAEDMGWQPNPAARALSGARTNAVGLVIARPHDAIETERFFFQFICGLEDVLTRHSYSLVLQIVETLEHEREIYQNWWQQKRVDGVILTDLRTRDPRPSDLDSLGLPAITVGHKTSNLPAVLIGDEAIATEVVDYLISRGHRDIAYVAGIMGLEHTQARAHAFEERAGQAGIHTRCLSTDYTEDSGLAVTRHLIDTPNRPSALIFDNEILALGGLTALAQAGLSIPEDVAVISFEDAPTCKIANPSITAVRRDPYLMGQQSADLLLRYLEDGSTTDIISNRWELVQRDSA